MSNWRNTIFLVRRGPDDYGKRFAAQYPAVYRWILRICDDAGTSDADWKVVQASAALLADYDDWAMRSIAAMRKRKATAFDSLVNEGSQLRGIDAETGSTILEGGAA